MTAQRGSSMVEFVIAAMLLMLFVFGIIDFGRALYTYHAVSDAARLGSRFAIVRGSKCIAPSSSGTGLGRANLRSGPGPSDRSERDDSPNDLARRQGRMPGRDGESGVRRRR